MTNALMLQGWDVIGVKVVGNVQEATATYNSLLDACPKCGSVGRLYRHGAKTIDYRDAPAFGKQFVIRCRVQRWRCRDCGETSMQPLPDMDVKRRMTRRCVEYIEQQCVPQTYAALARHVGVDEKTIRNICNEAMGRRVASLRKAIRAKALLMEPGGLRQCPYCKGEYPASSFKAPVIKLPPEASGHTAILEGMEPCCGNCHFRFHHLELELVSTDEHPLPASDSTRTLKFLERKVEP